MGRLANHTFGPRLENLFLGCVINKGANQAAHPHRLISTYVICFLESIISNLTASKISFFYFVVSRPNFVFFSNVPLLNVQIALAPSYLPKNGVKISLEYILLYQTLLVCNRIAKRLYLKAAYSVTMNIFGKKDIFFLNHL